MTAGQSRSASFFETLTGTITGFLVSVGIQRLLFPALGYQFTLADNALISTVFTLVSILRGYTIRRIFNAMRGHLP